MRKTRMQPRLTRTLVNRQLKIGRNYIQRLITAGYLQKRDDDLFTVSEVSRAIKEREKATKEKRRQNAAKATTVRKMQAATPIHDLAAAEFVSISQLSKLVGWPAALIRAAHRAGEIARAPAGYHRPTTVAAMDRWRPIPGPMARWDTAEIVRHWRLTPETVRVIRAAGLIRDTEKGPEANILGFAALERLVTDRSMAHHLTAVAAADLLGVTRQSIAMMIKRGVLIRLDDGTIDRDSFDREFDRRLSDGRLK